MGMFRTTDYFEVYSTIKGVPLSKALQVLHNHDFFLHQDPNFVSFASDTPPRGGSIQPVPDDAKDRIVPGAPTKCYEVTDKVPGQFAKLLPGMSKTINYYQVTDLKDGIFVYLNAALDTVSSRKIRVKAEGEGGVKLYQEVMFDTNKMLMGICRSQYEEHWRNIHEAFSKEMGGEIGNHGPRLS